MKKMFSLQNVLKKLFEMHYSLEKDCLQVPKMVTPPHKNNGPSLSGSLKYYGCGTLENNTKAFYHFCYSFLTKSPIGVLQES